jgi:CRP-like cAMP-binding protein
VKIRSFEKGEVLIEKGSTSKDIFFLRRGLARCYAHAENSEEEEITFQLFPEYHVFGNLYAIVLDEPSHFTYQVLEKTKAYSINYDKLFELSSENSDLLELNRTFLGKDILKRSFKRIESFVFYTPEERYQKYLKEYPSIANRAPDKYIANVLGITPTSLSRIRKRMATNKK